MRYAAVTGWKSLFVNKGFTKRINGVTKDESDMLLNYLFNVCFHVNQYPQPPWRTGCTCGYKQLAWANFSSLQLVTQNHDAQVRFKWNKNDLAIWDNRSNWHCATYDYAEARAGDRVCSLGEAPYLDILHSKSRREALAERS